MWSLLEKLNDPFLTADFQKLLGVEVLYDPMKDVSNATTEGVKNLGKDENTRKQRFRPEAEVTHTGSDSMPVLQHRIRNRFWFYLLHFSATLGNENFFATFFPFLYWNFDAYVVRQVVLSWGVTLYLGHLLKDVVRGKRPASPPVVRLVELYGEEYGMPSTHAMMGLAIPLSLVYFSFERYQFPWMAGAALVMIWTTLVCASRIYLGMHSILDVLVGLLLSFATMAVLIPSMDAINAFMEFHPYSPLVCPLVALALSVCYPHQGPARGDAVGTAWTLAGMAVAIWVNRVYPELLGTSNGTLYPNNNSLKIIVVRNVLGSTLLLLGMLVAKAVALNTFCRLSGYPKTHTSYTHFLVVQLPTKIVTYVLAAFNMVSFMPWLFQYLDIGSNAYMVKH